MNKYQESLDRIDQYRVNKNLKIDIKDILTLQELINKYQEIQNVYFKKEPMESADLNGEKLQELYNFINKLLDKATPKKPIEIEEKDIVAGKIIIYNCPSCNHGLFVKFIEINRVAKYKSNYCEVCGQALDWSEEE